MFLVWGKILMRKKIRTGAFAWLYPDKPEFYYKVSLALIGKSLILSPRNFFCKS